MKPQPIQAKLQLAGNTITLETGRIARLADGAVIARRGDDVVLATVVAARTARPGVDFFPLTVEYREKLAAAGRIPGNVQRREGRISDNEVLVSRLIDRTIRSLFPDEYRCEVQVQVQILSADPTSDVHSLALIAATAALHISPVPAKGPAAGLRIVRHRGAWMPFPSLRHRQEADLDFVVSAGPDGLVMVEGEADAVAEADCVAALAQALEWLQRVQKCITELADAAGKPKLAVPAAPVLPDLPADVETALAAALTNTSKAERAAAVDGARALLVPGDDPAAAAALQRSFDERKWHLVREAILTDGRRLDGRGPADIRPIWCEVGWLPRPHGSAVFTRGETQALVTCTLGTQDESQLVESLGGVDYERFLLHYNFPPYSVNEIRALRGPGRREIGHGALARRGLVRMLPTREAFPYTLRIESEIAESNGSSSMATVCGGTLAMFHAGVPMRAAVAGIAMGLVTDGARSAVLSDILGDEDHLGDMDFKVVGTAAGVTALQLDNKVGGLSMELLAAALTQAAQGRLHILAEMNATIAAPAAAMSAHAPRVVRTPIVPEAIGALVGTRGANIKAIQASTKSKITVDDDGVVLIYAAGADNARAAQQQVLRAAGVVRAGRYYRGVVTGVKDFGAFVRINPSNEGLVPIEDFGDRRGTDGPIEGAEIVVKVTGADDRGRLRLSRREAIDVDPALIEF